MSVVVHVVNTALTLLGLFLLAHAVLLIRAKRRRSRLDSFDVSPPRVSRPGQSNDYDD